MGCEQVRAVEYGIEYGYTGYHPDCHIREGDIVDEDEAYVVVLAGLLTFGAASVPVLVRVGVLSFIDGRTVLDPVVFERTGTIAEVSRALWERRLTLAPSIEAGA
ncbi:hypothetical protein JMUB6875_24450 [Nocardia sp. JMUB6875]|uniref:hypothetical protein n=1 Tax=Nocardia sp. JMUB6875 TaxID=3158170 RepID=UPI0032E64889